MQPVFAKIIRECYLLVEFLNLLINYAGQDGRRNRGEEAIFQNNFCQKSCIYYQGDHQMKSESGKDDKRFKKPYTPPRITELSVGRTKGGHNKNRLESHYSNGSQTS